MLVRAIGRAGAEARGSRLVEVGRLCAWIDEVPAVMDRAALLEHHRVVEGLGECLPARFGTVVEGEEALVEMLRAREEELLARLERVAGKRELAVTGLWVDADRSRVLADSGDMLGEDATGDGGAGAVGGPGRRYMEARRARARRAERARALAEEVARAAGVDREDARHVVPAVEGGRGGAGDDAAGQPGPGQGSESRIERVAFSSALLIEGERVAEAKGAIEALALPDVRLLVHGPWPPYTFAG